MARAQPGKLNWATVTGATDFILAGFLKSEGLDMAKIPYRDPVQAVNDVAEGRLHLYWSSYAIVRAAGAGRPREDHRDAGQRADPAAARHSDRRAGRLSRS